MVDRVEDTHREGVDDERVLGVKLFQRVRCPPDGLERACNCDAFGHTRPIHSRNYREPTKRFKITQIRVNNKFFI